VLPIQLDSCWRAAGWSTAHTPILYNILNTVSPLRSAKHTAILVWMGHFLRGILSSHLMIAPVSMPAMAALANDTVAYTEMSFVSGRVFEGLLLLSHKSNPDVQTFLQ
jgi:hypothetical protein